MSITHRFSKQQCFDVRDRVFALHGIVREGVKGNMRLRVVHNLQPAELAIALLRIPDYIKPFYDRRKNMSSLQTGLRSFGSYFDRVFGETAEVLEMTTEDIASVSDQFLRFVSDCKKLFFLYVIRRMYPWI